MRRRPWIGLFLLMLLLLAGCETEQQVEQVVVEEVPAMAPDESAFRAAYGLADPVEQETAYLAFLDDFSESDYRASALGKVWQHKLAANEAAALAWAQRALAEESSDTGKGALYQSLFMLAVEKDDPGEGLRLAREFWDMHYEAPGALNAIGWTLVENSSWDFQLGAAMGDRAADLADSEDSKAMYLDTAGWGYFKQGRYDLAALRLESALALMDEPDTELAAHLGIVYEKTGDDAKHLALLTEQLEYRIDGALMSEARALVRRRGGDQAAYEANLWQARDARAKEAPDFAMKDLDGVEHRLSDLRGKVVLLNFWHPT